MARGVRIRIADATMVPETCCDYKKKGLKALDADMKKLKEPGTEKREGPRMDEVGVEGDASKSRTFLLSYLWLPVRGAAAASSDIVTCCNLQSQALAMYIIFCQQYSSTPVIIDYKQAVNPSQKAV